MSGELFGPYRLEELIGRGGMGEVYRAFDTGRKRFIALKRLPAGLAADPGFQARFRAESELAARLRSAHVIPIHDYGEIDGRLFIDMRLVDGENLEDRLAARGAMSAADAVYIIGQVAGALDAAHAAGLVHRDVKPSNVLLSPGDGEGGRDFAYLADFGLARAVDATAGLTGTGAVIGTVSYMAPERFEGRPVDCRADVYSLACMLSEVLTGSPPFRCDSMTEAMYSHLHAPIPQPSQLLPGIPAAFDEVVLRGMAKAPQDRYPSAGALAAAARAALTAPAPPTGDPHRSEHADSTQSAAVPGPSESSTTSSLPGMPDLAATVVCRCQAVPGIDGISRQEPRLRHSRVQPRGIRPRHGSFGRQRPARRRWRGGGDHPGWAPRADRYRRRERGCHADYTDLAEASQSVATDWADRAYRDDADRAPTLTTAAPEMVTTVTGKPAAIVKVTATLTQPTGPCRLTTGTVYAISATGFTGKLGPTAVLVIVADTGAPGAVPETEIRQILTTLRPAP